ncbi:hypothetical protein [Roseobacter cerasinus]|nr:hypothetical protein [Roseobacter cerasinus]
MSCGGLQLVLIENADPILGRKARWFEDPELAAKGVNRHGTKAARSASA